MDRVGTFRLQFQIIFADCVRRIINSEDSTIATRPSTRTQGWQVQAFARYCISVLHMFCHRQSTSRALITCVAVGLQADRVCIPSQDFRTDWVLHTLALPDVTTCLDEKLVGL